MEIEEYNRRAAQLKEKSWPKKDQIDKEALRAMEYEPRKWKDTPAKNF